MPVRPCFGLGCRFGFELADREGLPTHLQSRTALPVHTARTPHAYRHAHRHAHCHAHRHAHRHPHCARRHAHCHAHCQAPTRSSSTRRRSSSA
eukprot:scaffold77027_cov45-Phaeocystis_antarctica.AAC.1